MVWNRHTPGWRLSRSGLALPLPLRTADYAKLASFRYALRNFLHFSEAVAARVGLTSQQYQALLAVRSLAGSGPVIHRAKLRRIGPDVNRILDDLAGAWRQRT